MGLLVPEAGARYRIYLMYCLQQGCTVINPRTLLKNGKRSAVAFLASRSRNSPNCQSPLKTINSPITPIDGDKPSDNHGSESLCCPENNRAIASLTRELGSLRHDVTQLKSDIVSLKSTSNNETCLIYVSLKNLERDDVHESLLNAILHCPIVCYSIICKVSLRVRIQKRHLHSALSSTDIRLDIVRLWRPNNATTAPSSSSSNPIENGAPCHPASAENPSPTTLNLTTWNCRGLGSGEPYIHQLAESGCDIIAVSEHWLWPFEADRLRNIHPAFTAEIKIDERLTENSTLRRGCGGGGIDVEKGNQCNGYLINIQ